MEAAHPLLICLAGWSMVSGDDGSLSRPPRNAEATIASHNARAFIESFVRNRPACPWLLYGIPRVRVLSFVILFCDLLHCASGLRSNIAARL